MKQFSAGMLRRIRNLPFSLSFLGISIAVATGMAALAYAVGTSELFEIGDAEEFSLTNIAGDPSSDFPDWNDLFTVTRDGDGNQLSVEVDEAALTTYGGLAAVFIQDDNAVGGSVDRSAFASSNKNNDPHSAWSWKTGNVPAKNDLTNVYAYGKVDDDPDSPTFGDLFVYAVPSSIVHGDGEGHHIGHDSGGARPGPDNSPGV